VWFSLSWGWYGMMLWLPEFFARLNNDDDGEGGASSSNVYAENMAVAWANLPGNVASAFLVDSIGRRATLVRCMGLAAIAAAAFAAGVSFMRHTSSTSPDAARRLYVASACVFNALSVGGWNSLDLYTSEAFPTDTRSTAMGALGALGRMGSLIGTSVNGAAIASGLMTPLALSAGAMLAGAWVTGSMTLETKGRELEDRGGGGGEGFFELVDEEELIECTSEAR
jgi:MFS family permease